MMDKIVNDRCVNCGSKKLETNLRCSDCERIKIESQNHLAASGIPPRIRCNGCKGWMVNYWDGDNKCYLTKCPRCDNKQLKDWSLTNLYNFRFENIVPPKYKAFDLARHPNPDKLKTIMEWYYDKRNPRGIFIAGETGTGKTFSLWQIGQKAIYAGLTTKALEANQFSHEVLKRFENGTYEAWFQSLLIPDLIIWDDFGKEIFSDRVSNDIFGLIEKRNAYGKLFFVTTQDDVNTLGAKMKSVDLARAILRRLTDNCNVHIME